MNIEGAKERLQNTSLFGRFKHAGALKYLTQTDEVRAVDILVYHLRQHPRSIEVKEILSKTQNQAKRDRMWKLWEEDRGSPLGELLKQNETPCKDEALMPLRLLTLGKTDELGADIPTCRKVCAYFEDSDPDIKNSVVEYLRNAPKTQEFNNVIFSVWLKTESKEIEKIIKEQRRLPGSGGKEALLYLVTGDVKGYHELKDDKGEYFAGAFLMASGAFKTRINQTVINSKDAGLTESYQKALGQGKDFDFNLYVKASKESGNEEALLEAMGKMDLLGALDLCERWQKTPFTPTNAGRARRLQQALESFKNVGKWEIEKGDGLPAGVTDLLSYWEGEKEGAGDLRQELNSPDPFVAARALCLGAKSGVVQSSDVDNERIMKHWPLQMASSLRCTGTKDSQKDHVVSWQSIVSDVDVNLLQCAIACTPDSYKENSARLKQLQSQGGTSLSYHLLNILVNFQGAFAEWLVVEDKDDATEKGAIEIIDVPSDALKF